MGRAVDELTQKQYIDQFRDALYNDLTSAVNIRKGHTEEIHNAQEDYQLANRLVHDKTIAFVSSFYDKETMEDALTSGLFYVAPKIAAWVQSSKLDFKNEDQYWTIAITINVGDDEPIGRGFDKNFREIESPDLTVVLQRDNTNENYYGFYLKTAYVDITTEHAEYTGVAYTKDEVTRLKGVVFESKMEELVFKNQNLFAGISIRYKQDKDRNDTIIMEYISKDKATKTLAYFQENSEPKIKEASLNGPMTRRTIHEIEPYFADAIANMQLQIRTIAKNKKIDDIER